MKRLIFILIFFVSFSAAGLQAQCVSVSSNVTICQGSTLASLGGAMLNGTKSVIWSDNGIGGTFSPGATTLKATWTPPAAFIGTATLTLTATAGCTSSPAFASFTVTVTAMPVATFSYPATPYCSVESNPFPAFSGGGVAGTFSSTTGLVFISASTGQVNLAASTAGTYTVTNTIAAAGGCSKVTATSTIAITASPSAIITYAGNPFCKSISTAQAVTRTGTSGGTYSSTAGLSINSSTGAITPSTSTAGTYIVTYTMPATGGCPAGTATTVVTITAIPVATFSYTSSPYCSNSTNPLPTFSGGGVAGSFSSTTGLVFVSTVTGQVNLAASTPGTYTVTNAIAAAGGCSRVTATSSITITAYPSATIQYQGTPYCKSLTSAQPVTRTGSAGGTYSSTTGLTINSSTGAVTPSTSTAGTYTVTYTIAASGGCGAVVVTTSVSITAIPSAPKIGVITQPTCTLPAGSVALSGLPATGTWTVTTIPGGATLSGSGTTAIITSLSPGTYTFTVTAGNNCASAASSNAVINAQPGSPSPPVVGTITQPVCSVPTGSVFLSGLPATGSWVLTRNPGAITQNGSGTTVTVSSLTPGTYTFTVTNSDGCSSGASANVVINTATSAPTAPVIGNITQPTCAISTGSVVLSGLPSSGNWALTRNPDGLVMNGSGSSITISSLAGGVYTFTVTNSSGCISPQSAQVTINQQPQTPAAPFVSIITPPTCTLSTGGVTLSNLPSSGTWTLIRYPGTIQTTGTGTIAIVNGLQPGVYNFTVTNSAGCLSVPSLNVFIPSQPVTPGTPLVTKITQPTLDIPSGSVTFAGLPASGTWIIKRLPGGSAVTGSGETFEITGLPDGIFTFTVTNSSGCSSPETNQVKITSPDRPVVVINDPPELCFPDMADLTKPSVTAGSSPGLSFTYWTDQNASIPLTTPSSASSGTYYIKGTASSGFFTIKPVSVTVDQPPVPYAGEDQSLDYTFSTNLDATLNPNESGLWSLVSGTANFSSEIDPKTYVENLSLGDNVLVWSVKTIACPVATDTMKITVKDFSFPTLITPNMDGKNDYLIIRGIGAIGKTELYVFDRQGVVVFKNSDYDNLWNGVDYNGKPLPEDTYFYIVRSQNGRSYKGFIVLRR
jgi:large repetitive protein